MTTPLQFEQQYESEWAELEHALEQIRRRRISKGAEAEVHDADPGTRARRRRKQRHAGDAGGQAGLVPLARHPSR